MSSNNKKQKPRISRKNIDNKNKQDIKNRKRNPIVRGLVISFIAVAIFVVLFVVVSSTIGYIYNLRKGDFNINANKSSTAEESYIRETVNNYFRHFKVSKITYKDTSSTGLGNYRYSSHEYLVGLTNDMSYCGLDGLVFEYVAENYDSKIYFNEPTIMGVNGDIDQYENNGNYGRIDDLYSYKDTDYSEKARNNLITLMNTTYRDYCNRFDITHLKDVVNSVFMKDAITDMNQDLALNQSRKIENYYLIDATNTTDQKRINIIFYLENNEWVIVKTYL